MFVECYDEKPSWETNLQERPEGVQLDQWVSYLQYKVSEKGKSYSEKNTASRCKQKITHTLGSKSIARKQYELETQTGRPYSRLEMYTIAHKKKDGSFVNEEARQQIEQLEREVDNNASEEDAFTTVIGKEHHGYVRGMGFGVCPSKVFKGFGSTSTNGSSAQVNKLQSELETGRSRVDTLVQEVERFKGLEAQLAFVMQQLVSQGFNQVSDLGSPNEPRRSSSASHNPGNKGPSS
ncbi:uncharacterized protein LOC130738697 isoform X2 [Lotus japonicus]|uniref:uncharacterized protein LOC130738697 isoform X2 n=1 Tax=Lotus japonicus TaxID=34305 RepID=UPI002589440D|nr:uncharacterized protein LOC130738697 isoform X2 [Lotus japonicus]